MTAGRTRSTRDRPAKSPLSEAAVVDAALSILHTEGLEAVTMRRVAAELETGPASLYVYVAGRDGLLLAMFDRINGTVALEPPDATRWREQLHALLGRMRAALLDYPGIAAAIMVEPPVTESTLLIIENLLGLLLAAGLDPQDAAFAADLLSLVVTSGAIESDTRNLPEADLATTFRAKFAALPAATFPLITGYAEQLTAGDSTQRFTFAIDVILDGLLARSGRSR